MKKEYRLLHGSSGNLTVLGAAVSAFTAVPAIGSIVITVPHNAQAAAVHALPPQLLAEHAVPPIHFVSGGTSRRASVFNALTFLAALAAGAPDYVLIHDGARPWINPELIQRIITAVMQYDAVIPLLPLVETPKETEVPLSGDGPVFIKQHLRRALVGTAQTPQAFAFPGILAAHEQAVSMEESRGFEFTDDAEIWAAFCGPVAAISGESTNNKITFAQDLPC